MSLQVAHTPYDDKSVHKNMPMCHLTETFNSSLIISCHRDKLQRQGYRKITKNKINYLVA